MIWTDDKGNRHHDMGTCYCGEHHAREHVLARRVTELEAENERLREAMRRGAALDIELAGAEIPPETDGGGA